MNSMISLHGFKNLAKGLIGYKTSPSMRATALEWIDRNPEADLGEELQWLECNLFRCPRDFDGVAYIKEFKHICDTRRVGTTVDNDDLSQEEHTRRQVVEYIKRNK